jgi:metal-responsive CopG/Arc/MetJ family transcriptional regulator
MSVPVMLPDELAAEIDGVAEDRSAFVAEAVRRLLQQSSAAPAGDRARIDAFAEELNREMEDVLEFQVLR